MDDYAAQKIWIIGASSGIGRALAFELASRGATLALSGRSESKLHTLNNELGGKHHVFSLDVRDVDGFQETAQSIQKIFSRLDRVIFMAAVYEPERLEQMDIKAAHQMVDINLKGALNAIYAVLPVFQSQINGQLVLCGSVAGYRGLPNGQPYCATKAAIISLAETLYIENPELDIKVINPGFVRTPLTDKNDFKMPMMIEPQQAAIAIAKGLKSRKSEIHFPKKFTYIMKFIKLLPAFLYLRLVRRIRV